MIIEKNRKIFSWHQAATWFFILIIAGSFLFFKETLAYTGDYNKPINGTLSASEWNNLINDFVVIRNSGNVGIGTTTPAYKLHVLGDISIGANNKLWLFTNTNMSATSNAFQFNSTQSNGWTFNNSIDGTNERMRITAAGLIGIGTNNPNSKLQIYGSSGSVIDVSGGRITGLDLTPLVSTDAVPLGYLQSNYTPSSGSLWGGQLTGAVYSLNSGNVGIGTSTPAYKLTVMGDIFVNGLIIGKSGGNRTNNIAFGKDALISNTTGDWSIAIGSGALWQNATGTNNTAIGGGALFSNTSGQWNMALGTSALASSTEGSYNTAIGPSAMFSNKTGTSSTAIGVSALYFNSFGSSNIAVGRSALYNNTTGSNNLGVGNSSLGGNLIGNNNVAIGHQAARYISGSTSYTSANNSIYIGALTKPFADGMTNEIVIGYDAKGLGSNSVLIGSSSILTTVLRGNVGIGTTTPSSKLSITGSGVVLNVSGNRIGGLDLTPLSADEAVPLGYLQANYASVASSFWVGSSTSHIYSSNIGNVGIGTVNPGSKLTLFGGDFEMENNKSIKINSSTSDTTLLLGNYGDGQGFGYGTSTTRKVSLAVEGDVKANRFCIGEDCKDTWQQIVYAGGGGNAVYVGMTAKTTGNNNGVSGYREAARLCNEVVEGSHVCTPDDMLNTIALNSLMPSENVWVFTGPPGYTAVANDCDGRSTNSNSSALGAFWEVTNPSFPNGGRGLTSPCGANLKLACCK
jgi:hypothetical protein